MSFNIKATNIAGVLVLESSVFQDNRGAFSRLFCLQELKTITQDRNIVQINHSRTNTLGAIRGMHYQNPPHAEMKVIRCLKGHIYDVAVDLRADSSTFMKWTAVELTPENHFALVIPEGCAHGFQVLQENSELLYLHTAFYTPSAEDGVKFDDPAIGINWPLPVADISTRDSNHPYLNEDFKGIKL